MKNFTLAILLLFVVKSIAAQGCMSDANCGEDQCCVARGFFRNCENRLTEDQQCIPRIDFGVHLYRCPCKFEFACQAREYRIVPFFGRVGVDARCSVIPGNDKPVSDNTVNESPDETDVESNNEEAPSDD